MSGLEDNNPQAGAGADLASVDSDVDIVEDIPITTDSMIATDHFATVIDADDSGAGSNTFGFPSFKDSYDTASHDVSDSSNGVPKDFSSRIEQLLIRNPDLEILIVDAGKNSEGHGGGYIAYTIRTGDLSVRRRYSEFESLRNALTRLFPTLIVPPIPEKHTMADYAAKPTKAKEDLRIIDHRRRMLAVFLNRCRAMKQIREHPVFQKFFDPNVSWIEVLNSEPISTIPKSILRAPPLDPGHPTPEHSYLPVPSPSARLKEGDDSEFQHAEIKAKEYEIVMTSGIDKVNKQILKRYSEIAYDLADLGARYNAWSLDESNSLADAVEGVGMAVDDTYTSTEGLISFLSSSFSEPLGESAQFASVVRAVLKYRHQKALQLETTASALAIKRHALDGLERTEMESQRINDYLLKRDQNFLGGENEEPFSSVPNAPATAEAVAEAELTNEYAEAATDGQSTDPESGHLASEDASTTTIRGLPPMEDTFPISGSIYSGTYKKRNGFRIPGIGKLTDAFHGIVEVDPETTRRNNIGKLREEIQIFEATLKVAQSDLEEASGSIRADLARYQNMKEQDLRKMMIAYGKCHIEWARKNLETWERAKVRIDGIKVK
ncbi:hypothetical protein V1512DRAFT_18406 [Lipomyces arxii]|uniref:uncharacterized protein n=1 Tax=Lipomyces arxii TaxID=56418 RepID=UPI0034CE8340